MVEIFDPIWSRKYEEYKESDFPIGKELYYKTPAVELNFFLTLVTKVQELVPILAEEMNYSKEIKVITEYPKDLNEFKAPSIVIRQVNTDNDEIMQAGKVVIIENEDSPNIELDTYTMRMNFYIQFDCVGGTKLDRLVLKCIMQDCLVRMQRFSLLDFTGDYINGIPMKLEEEIRIPSDWTQWNTTHDTLKYIAIYRQHFYTKMIIVPYDNIVDLTKMRLDSYTFIDDAPPVEDIITTPSLYEENKTSSKI